MVDPLAPDYPWYTPYQFAGNSPILNIDRDGLEPWNVNDPNGEETTTRGPWRNQEQAELSLRGELFLSYNLPSIEVRANSGATSNSTQGFSQNMRGGALASSFNGLLRVNYAVKSLLTYPLYLNGSVELRYMNMMGSLSRFTQKEFTRINTIGGRAHLDFVDRNTVKFGTRFYKSNLLVNGMGFGGVLFGGYHAYQTGKTYLSLGNSQDRFDFAAAETVRNLGAISQMRVASSTYSGVSLRFGLMQYRSLNILGAFGYTTLRAGLGSTGWGLAAEGALRYSNIMADPETERLWNQNEAKNPYKNFVFRNQCFSCWQWLRGTNKKD